MSSVSLVCYELSSSDDDIDCKEELDDCLQKEHQSISEVDIDVRIVIDRLLDQLCGRLSNRYTITSSSLCTYRDPNEIIISESSTDNDDEEEESDNNTNNSSSIIDLDDSDVEFAKILEIGRRKRMDIAVYKNDDGNRTSRRHGTTTMKRSEHDVLSSIDLPAAIETLNIHADDRVPLMRLGCIHSIVDCLVIVLSDHQVPALDDGTILFDSMRDAIGRVFEVFGPVVRPLYSIRFASAEQIGRLSIGSVVLFAPTEQQWTKPVFVEALRRLRGSDASWKEDCECPVEEQDFSDDEEERRSRAKRKIDRREQITTVDGSIDEQPSQHWRGGERGRHRGGARTVNERGRRRGGARGHYRGGRDERPPPPPFTSYWPPSSAPSTGANSMSHGRYTAMIDTRRMNI